MHENNNYLDFAPLLYFRQRNVFDEAYLGTPALKKKLAYTYAYNILLIL